MALSLPHFRTAPPVIPVQMGWFISLTSGDFLWTDMDRVLAKCQALGRDMGKQTEDRTV